MNIFKNISIYCMLVVILNSCHAQAPTLDSCKKNYKIARQQVNLFYKDTDTSHLFEALKFSQRSQNCEETRLGSIDLKTSLFVLLKKYKEGANFIDSLTENDFKKQYKKQMYFRFFIAMGNEVNGDTSARDITLSKAAGDIKNYISTEMSNSADIDEEAWYDLFFIEKRYKSMSQINSELDSLRIKYPATNFFTDLKQSFQETQTAEAQDLHN